MAAKILKVFIFSTKLNLFLKENLSSPFVLRTKFLITFF